MIIHYIRHGESRANAAKTMAGDLDEPLSPLGEIQAKALGEHLELPSIDAIYCSNLQRAKNTAEPVARRLGLEVEVLPLLNEINLGAFSTRTMTQAREQLPEAFANSNDSFWTCFSQGNIPGQEKISAVQARNEKFLDLLLERHDKASNIVAVGHKGFLDVWIAKRIGFELDESYLSIDNTSITSLEVDRDTFRILSLNNTRHLKGIDPTRTVL